MTSHTRRQTTIRCHSSLHEAITRYCEESRIVRTRFFEQALDRLMENIDQWIEQHGSLEGIQGALIWSAPPRGETLRVYLDELEHERTRALLPDFIPSDIYYSALLAWARELLIMKRGNSARTPSLVQAPKEWSELAERVIEIEGLQNMLPLFDEAVHAWMGWRWQQPTPCVEYLPRPSETHGEHAPVLLRVPDLLHEQVLLIADADNQYIRTIYRNALAHHANILRVRLDLAEQQLQS